MPTRKPVRMLDLFSGIGGFSLAAQWVFGDDLEIVGFCEREPFCQKVLQKNFPSVPIHNDITELDGSEFEDIDLLTGGFPCQDISVAGTGKGIVDGKRSSLWFEMQRIISRVRPKFAVIENVPALTYRGGVEVIRSLAESGYDAEWQIISAKQVGARHLRKRIWIVAYPRHRSRRNLQSRDAGLCGRQQTEKTIRNTTSTQITGSSKTSETLSNTESERLSRCRRKESGGNKKRVEQNSQEKQSEVRSKSKRCSGVHGDVSNSTSNRRIGRTGNKQERQADSQREWSDSESQQEGKRLWSDSEQTRYDRRSKEKEIGETWILEPQLGRVAHGIQNRSHRLRALGNAIVPQNAQVIFEYIKPFLGVTNVYN